MRVLEAGRTWTLRLSTHLKHRRLSQGSQGYELVQILQNWNVYLKLSDGSEARPDPGFQP